MEEDFDYGSEAGFLMDSQKRAEPRFHSKDFTQPPKGTPNSQRDANSHTLNLRERWSALRPFQRNSPFRMGEWQFHPWDWSGQQVGMVKRFLFCWIPSDPSCGWRRQALGGLVLTTPLGVRGLQPVLLPRQEYTRGQEINTLKQQGSHP